MFFLSLQQKFVAATQPINSLAFVFDGVNFGASDFAYSAYSMVNSTMPSYILDTCISLLHFSSSFIYILVFLQILVAIVSIGSLFALSKTSGFVGIWLALTIYMSLRAFAGVWR